MPVFRILGSLELGEFDGDQIFESVLARGLMTVLLLHANRYVSHETLVQYLGAGPRVSARETLRNYAAQVRRGLPLCGSQFRARLTTRRSGPAAEGAYRLMVCPGELDLDVFDQLSQAAV